MSRLTSPSFSAHELRDAQPGRVEQSRASRGRAGRRASPTSGAASSASTSASVSVFGKRGGRFGGSSLSVGSAAMRCSRTSELVEALEAGGEPRLRARARPVPARHGSGRSSRAGRPRSRRRAPRPGRRARRRTAAGRGGTTRACSSPARPRARGGRRTRRGARRRVMPIHAGSRYRPRAASSQPLDREVEAVVVAGEAADPARGDHAVAGDREREVVRAARLADRARAGADVLRHLAVAADAPGRDLGDLVPDAALVARADRLERQLEAPATDRRGSARSARMPRAPAGSSGRPGAHRRAGRGSRPRTRPRCRALRCGCRPRRTASPSPRRSGAAPHPAPACRASPGVPWREV